MARYRNIEPQAVNELEPTEEVDVVVEEEIITSAE